jgi:hypothetical protein
LQAFAQHIPIWIADGQLTKLHLIGPTGDEFSQQADELIAAWPNASAAVRHGALPPSEVSSILACAQYALTNINPETWSKSSAFIACAAHGCTVVRTGLRTEVGPLSHTLTAEEVGRLAPDELEQRTTALARWYEEHAAWPVIAKKLGASFDDRGQRP